MLVRRYVKQLMPYLSIALSWGTEALAPLEGMSPEDCLNSKLQDLGNLEI